MRGKQEHKTLNNLMLQHLSSSWQRNAKIKKHFPGDPHYENEILLLDEDFESLKKDAWLSTQLLDCLNQEAAPPPDDDQLVSFFLAGLGAKVYIESLLSLFDKKREKIKNSTTMSEQQYSVWGKCDKGQRGFSFQCWCQIIL